MFCLELRKRPVVPEAVVRKEHFRGFLLKRKTLNFLSGGAKIFEFEQGHWTQNSLLESGCLSVQ